MRRVFMHCLSGLSVALTIGAMTAGVATHSARAMSVTPLIIDMTASGNGNHTQISVVNDGSKRLPVEIVISRVELDEKGEATAKPANDEFLVFPPQALLAPGAAQNFRIQWVGDPQLKASQSYAFSVNQVPVKMPEGKSGVQVVFNFGCIVNVAPMSGQAALNLISAGVEKDNKGAARPSLTVKNSGNIHAKLTDATIKLTSGSWSQTLTPDRMRQVLSIGLVQPGKTRRILLPVDLPPGVGSLSASIDYKPGK
jgi:fimbrial chaperone protein